MQAIVPSLEVTGGGGGDLEEVVEQLASELFTALGSTLLSCQRDPTLLYTGTCPAAAAAAAAYSHTHPLVPALLLLLLLLLLLIVTLTYLESLRKLANCKGQRKVRIF